MFVCEKCHEGKAFRDCWLCEYGPESYGKCEVCELVVDCTDCHSYRAVEGA